MFLLLTILGLAVGIRVWGIDFGLPHEITYEQLTYEEAKEVHRAFKLAAGEYTWMFGKGGMYYFLFLEYAVFYIISWILGWVKNTQEFALWALQDRTIFFLMGRITVALMGTLTCLVIYGISKRLYGWRTALGTALIGALGYYHTLFSSVINVDIGMVLAFYASLLVYLQYERTQRRGWLIGAGVLGGVAQHASESFYRCGVLDLSQYKGHLMTKQSTGIFQTFSHRQHSFFITSISKGK